MGRMGTKTAVVLMGLVAFALILGAIVRLSIAHADPTTLYMFITSVAVPGIPAAAAWYTGNKAKQHAEGAMVAATNAQENTNGKLDTKFSEVSALVNDLTTKMDQHLTFHDEVGK